MRSASSKAWRLLICAVVLVAMCASGAGPAQAKKKSRRKTGAPVAAASAGAAATAKVAGTTLAGTTKKKRRRRPRRHFASAPVELAAQAGGVPAAPTAPAAKEEPPKEPTNDCARDSDCALVADGCCGCNEGGKQTAVPAREKDAYESGRLKHCGDMACTEKISDDPTCALHAICESGLCEVGDPSPPEREAAR